MPKHDTSGDRVLTGPRIALGLIAEDDRELYRALYTSCEVMAATAPPLSIEAADAQFDLVLRHDAAAKPGHRAWAVESAMTSDGIGSAVLHRRGDKATAGSMLRRDEWRQRMASGIFPRLLPQAFLTPGLRQATAHSRLPVKGLLAALGFIPGSRQGDMEVWTLGRKAWRHEPDGQGKASEVPQALLGADANGGDAGLTCSPGTVGPTHPLGTPGAERPTVRPQGEDRVRHHRIA